MNFLVAAALAVGLLLAVPVAAHLLRRGQLRERDFPPAALVPATRAVARRRSRLEDRALLAVRGLLILALAVLGATPLVKCSRLSLARKSGGSVALALVIDDSLSMRAQTAQGPTRFRLAMDGAQQLLSSAREGDAIAIVLAGRPARLALALTTDLGAARRALDQLEPSDRATDLVNAAQIARATLRQLPHLDKRVVLLSDLAGDEVPPGSPEVWAPLPGLRQPLNDCGITSAERRGKRVSIEVACNTPAAAQNRQVEIRAGESTRASKAQNQTPVKTGALASADLEARKGEQIVGIELASELFGLEAHLLGQDTLAEDDSAPIATQTSSLAIALVADPATSSVTTGGPTIIEQALSALFSDVKLRPMTSLPDDQKEFASLSAVIVDDPTGMTPEMRAALGAWIEHGGVALALLGPNGESLQLGSNLEPFARGVVHWRTSPVAGLNVTTVAWMGAEAASLADLAPKARAGLEGAEMPGAKIVGRWSDGHPWMTELVVRDGVVLTIGQPASTRHSDLALRPGFLALLEYVMEQAERRTGPHRSLAGSVWAFPSGAAVEVFGPDGKPLAQQFAPAGTAQEGQKLFAVNLHGTYRVLVQAQEQARIVTLEPAELIDLPREPRSSAVRASASGGLETVDVSWQAALIALLLFAAEAAMRLLGRLRWRRAAVG